VLRSDLMPRYYEMLSAPDISSDIRQVRIEHSCVFVDI